MGIRKRFARRRRALRVFFATDIHGSDRCFRKFLAAAPAYGADVLVLGGDVAGKAVVPIVDRGAAGHTAIFHGKTQVVSSEGLPELEGKIRFNGLYPVRLSEEEHRDLREDQSRQEALLLEVIRSQCEAWRELATERLEDQTRLLVTPGNDDPRVVDEVFMDDRRIEFPEAQVVEVGPLALASLGFTNPTPWDTEREVSEERLTEMIDDMMQAYRGDLRVAFNFHCPPHDSGLDTVNALDKDFRPIVKSGEILQAPAGSTAVREAIGRYDPSVALHGHIHESHGVCQIGRTTCINPGSEYSSGVLRGALVDVAEDGTVLNHLLTSG